jgi:hypothetical protein
MNSKNLIKLKALNVAIAMLCVCILFFASCKEEDGGGGIKHDPSQPVTVTSFMPDSGRISEMVLLDGANFGTDTSNIRVYFNAKRAITLSSSGSRILALVPRLPGDTCVVSVEVGGKKVTYPEPFRYKIEASVSTFAGNGNCNFIFGPIDKLQIDATYLCTDENDNLFVAAAGNLLKINIKDNSTTMLLTYDHGMRGWLPISQDTETGMLMMGNTDDRDQFLFLDPKAGYSPKYRFITEWITNGFAPVRVDSPAHVVFTHCKADGYYYTRYGTGQLVKINPKTWVAEIVYITPSGTTYGFTFNPKRPSELWMAYNTAANGNRIYTMDISNPAGTFKNLNEGGSGHRDGKIETALFDNMRQMNFDSEGNLFICDAYNACVRKIDVDQMTVETIIGIPGVHGFKNGYKEEAIFNEPQGLAIDSEDVIYVSDYGSCRVRRIAIE